jgi:hypothetical protein
VATNYTRHQKSGPIIIRVEGRTKNTTINLEIKAISKVEDPNSIKRKIYF